MIYLIGIISGILFIVTPICLTVAAINLYQAHKGIQEMKRIIDEMESILE